MSELDPDEYRRVSAVELAAAVDVGDLTSDDVHAAATAVHHATHDRINAVVEWFGRPDRADAHRTGSAGPLAGVPILVKDYGSAVAGRLVEMGSRLAAGNRAPQTAELMTRLLRAGAQLVGRSATPELIQHGTTESRVNGVTRNPHDPTVSAGGSSGGAGAAVAAGVVPAAHASDCAGSIRIPAAVCGLVGLKPGRDRVSMRGWSAGGDWNGIAAEFVLTRTVDDARLLLDVLGNGDDALSAVPRPNRCRVALSLDHWAGFEPDADVVAAAEAAARRLEDAGHLVEPLAPPLDYEQLGSTWHALFSSAVADDVEMLTRRHGRSADESTLEPVTRAVLAEVARLRPADRLVVEQRRTEITRRLETELAGFDAILTPTLGRSVIPLRWVGGEVGDTADDLDEYLRRNDELFPYSYLFNVTGWPSLSIPVGGPPHPLGVQLSGPRGSEQLLLDIGAQAMT